MALKKRLFVTVAAMIVLTGVVLGMLAILAPGADAGCAPCCCT